VAHRNLVPLVTRGSVLEQTEKDQMENRLTQVQLEKRPLSGSDGSRLIDYIFAL